MAFYFHLWGMVYYIVVHIIHLLDTRHYSFIIFNALYKSCHWWLHSLEASCLYIYSIRLLVANSDSNQNYIDCWYIYLGDSILHVSTMFGGLLRGTIKSSHGINQSVYHYLTQHKSHISKYSMCYKNIQWISHIVDLTQTKI